MGKYSGFNTHAQFHESYLKELFRAKNINYSKKNPGDVLKEYYLEQLLKRVREQNEDLPSFQEFINFCASIRLDLPL
jgi:parvulin-like peptidyl-prolyl isomerase